MGLAEIVRGGIALANTMTGSLQTTVLHEAWTGIDATALGAPPTFGDAVTRPALVEWTHRVTRNAEGEEIVQVATVTFIGPIAAQNGTSERSEPIDPRDRITLPNGYIGKVLSVNGLVDPASKAPYMLQVAIG